MDLQFRTFQDEARGEKSVFLIQVRICFSDPKLIKSDPISLKASDRIYSRDSGHLPVPLQIHLHPTGTTHEKEDLSLTQRSEMNILMSI